MENGFPPAWGPPPVHTFMKTDRRVLDNGFPIGESPPSPPSTGWQKVCQLSLRGKLKLEPSVSLQPRSLSGLRKDANSLGLGSQFSQPPFFSKTSCFPGFLDGFLQRIPGKSGRPQKQVNNDSSPLSRPTRPEGSGILAGAFDDSTRANGAEVLHPLGCLDLSGQGFRR